MTTEARLAFVVFIFAVWCFLGLMAWAAAAVVTRGRGALPALPLALAAGCAAGVAVPVLGARDLAGLFVSLFAATIGAALGSVAGIFVARRLGADGLSTGSARRKASLPQVAQHGPDVETD